MNMKTAKLLLITMVAAAIALAAPGNPDLINLVMPDAKVVSGVNITTAKGSPFGQFLLSQMQKDDQGLQELITTTGFGPRNDLYEVLMATVDPQQKNTGVVLAYGKFDINRILSAVQQKGDAVVAKYRGFDTITSQKTTDTGLMGFLSNSLAVMGDQASVKAAMDRRAGGNKADQTLSARIIALSSQFDAWFFSDVPGASVTGRMPMPNLGGGDGNNNMLQAILSTSGGIHFGSNLDIHGEAQTRSDKDAVALMNVVQFITSLIQMNREKPGAETAARLVDSLNVRTDKSKMTLDLSLPETDIEQLFQQGRPHRTARKTADL